MLLQQLKHAEHEKILFRDFCEAKLKLICNLGFMGLKLQCKPKYFVPYLMIKQNLYITVPSFCSNIMVLHCTTIHTLLSKLNLFQRHFTAFINPCPIPKRYKTKILTCMP